jgi:hypothetical protein
MLCAAGDSAHASGVPGSLDHLLWQYCVLEFFIGALGCFPVSNNAALFAEARCSFILPSYVPSAYACPFLAIRNAWALPAVPGALPCMHARPCLTQR